MTLRSESNARERFEHDTAEHQITVLKDDGLYRHLRFKKPETSFYWYDIVTWPGRLVVCGDMGDYMFSRISDMFDFFEKGDQINPHYWSQKLQGCPTHARSYSHDAFCGRVREWAVDVEGEMPPEEAVEFRAAVAEQLLDHEDAHDESAAFGLLRDFEHAGRRIYDPSDWELREYDFAFLWCCWAIVGGIRRYRSVIGQVAA